MAVFKCKMCGGALEINNKESVVTCDYCNTQQTLPKLNGDKKANLFDRANHFRRNNEFDKAMGIYEQILNEDKTDSESYWSLVLCRYGIEYVEEPGTRKRVPTVNRAQFTSIFDDSNYKAALEYADGSQKAVYEEEAKVINEIQKGILAISQKEEPFDVFICYKESDNNGRRTPDSVLANDLYHQLTQEGFKVFFSRITLEDKLGSAYEPYIFAALNSAKVMVVLGTKPEYFSAVWVKNEWSRYLAMIKSGEKKMLIPAYKDMDPYELPEEFSHLQAQDMSKLGFMQDLIRGIKKIVGAEEERTIQTSETITTSVNANIEPLLKRAFMFLEDGEWASADEYCEKVLDMDPENAKAYVGKLMVELNVRKQQELEDYKKPFDQGNNYQKAYRFGDEKLKKELEDCNNNIRNRIEIARMENLYSEAMTAYESAHTEEEYENVGKLFEKILSYKDAENMQKKCLEEAEKRKWERKEEIYIKAVKMLQTATNERDCYRAEYLFGKVADYKDTLELKRQCKEKAEIIKKDTIYAEAKTAMEKDVPFWLEEAKRKFESISDWKDSKTLSLECKNRIEEIKKAEELARKEAEKKATQKKRNAIVAVIMACIVIVVVIVIYTNNKYNSAVELANTGKYEDAIVIFESLNGHKDSQEKIEECRYNLALEKMENGKYIEAYEILVTMNGYKDSITKAEALKKDYIVEKGKKVKVGEYIIFGSYEQDNNASNGKEGIEWLVLEKKDNRLLVVSQYGLDCQKYHSDGEGITWEYCDLRTWLNNDFMNDAFDSVEKEMIPAVTFTADKNSRYNTDVGNNITDQVFLLSVNEVNTYFTSVENRKCKLTEYAEANKGRGNANNGIGTWWLRTNCISDSYAVVVVGDGSLWVDGVNIEADDVAVRPALWIDLDS